MKFSQFSRELVANFQKIKFMHWFYKKDQSFFNAYLGAFWIIFSKCRYTLQTLIPKVKAHSSTSKII
jgi:hypothetical protein